MHILGNNREHYQVNAVVPSGVEPGMVRLSVGLELIDDILADLEIGFDAALSLRVMNTL